MKTTYDLYIYNEETLEITAVLTGSANDDIEAYAMDNFSDYAWCYTPNTLSYTLDTVHINLNQ